MAATSRRQEWMIATLPIDPDAEILELGCGHGVAATLICARLKEGRYVGIDRSPKMISAAESRNLANIESGLATFLEAPVGEAELEGHFDIALAIHFPPLLRQTARREVDTVRTHLEDDGRLWVGVQPLEDVDLDDSIEDIRTRLGTHDFVVDEVIRGSPDGRPSAMIAGRPV